LDWPHALPFRMEVCLLERLVLPVPPISGRLGIKNVVANGQFDGFGDYTVSLFCRYKFQKDIKFFHETSCDDWLRDEAEVCN